MYAQFLKDQINEKKRKNDKMNDEEFRYNKEILSEINNNDLSNKMNKKFLI